ncbi:MAG: hypothetical protein GX753_03565 [Erysipelothrix sp.]|nr:hypothetical protein [Erysipelothrix sp.]
MKTNSVEMLLQGIPNIEEIKGEPKTLIEAFGFFHARTSLSLCTFVESDKFVSSLPPNAVVVITKPSILVDAPCVIYTDHPRDIFYQMHTAFHTGPPQQSTISKEALVSSDAIISSYGVVIESGAVIEAGAVVKSNVRIGKNTVIRSGAIIGGAGFQMHTYANGETHYIEHRGFVDLGESVEIQQNTCIDKAIFSWEATRIGAFTKIASQVQIAHGSQIGQYNLIASGTNFGGRVEVGERNWFGLNAVVSNGIKIGNNNRINLGSVVTQNIDNDRSVSGNFAIDHEKFISNLKGQVK